MFAKGLKLTTYGIWLVLLAILAPSASAQVEEPCEDPLPRWTCEPFTGLVAQDVDCEVFETSPWGWGCPPMDMELNNVGYRYKDGLLYGIQLNPYGNDGLGRTGGDCSHQGPRAVSGLPTDKRFDAGDFDLDGDTLYVYVHESNPANQVLYKIDVSNWCSGLSATSIPVTGDTGVVHDWATNPADGLLYGGDQTHGEVAVLDPDTGFRRDFDPFAVPPVTDLLAQGTADPNLAAYGAARFAADNLLVLYRNGKDGEPVCDRFTDVDRDGWHFEINVVTQEVIASEDTRGSCRNDAATCTGTPLCNWAFVMQDTDCKLFQCLPAQPPPFNPIFPPPTDLICEPPGELNNMGYRYQDEKLYGIKLVPGGHAGVVQLDPYVQDCNVVELGIPWVKGAGQLPNWRFDAGDVSRDGNWLYVNMRGAPTLFYRVDLTNLASLTAEHLYIYNGNLLPNKILATMGHVHDWAYRDGKLYGGDDTHGQVAVLEFFPDEANAQYVVRRDYAVVADPILPVTGLACLPEDVDYGGAWFTAEGKLVLHQNREDPSGNGWLYTIDITQDPMVIEMITEGREAGGNHNDGTSCIPQ